MNKPKYNLPNRIYCRGSKKMAAFRVHSALLAKLSKAAQELGWTSTDLVETAVDQFVVWHDSKFKRGSKQK